MFDSAHQPSTELLALLRILQEEGLHAEIQNFGCDVPIFPDDDLRYFFILAREDEFNLVNTAILPCSGPECKPDIPWNWYDIVNEVYVTPEDLADPSVFKRIIAVVAAAPTAQQME